MARDLNLQVLFNAVDRVTGPLRTIQRGGSLTARALKNSRDEVKKLNQAQSQVRGFQQLRDGLRQTSTRLDDARERVRQLREAQQRGEGTTAQWRRQMRQANEAVRDLTERQKTQTRELGDSRRALRQAGINTRNLASEEERLERQLQRANNRIQRQQRFLERLGKADLSGRFRNMRTEVGQFGRRAVFAGAAAAGSLFALTNSTASLGDEVAKTGDKIGINLGTFQELRYAAERSGVATASFDSSLERFVKRLGEARSETGAAKKAYEELGLSATELSQLDPDDALAQVADRLDAVENHAQKVALAAQLFGREGVSMLNMLRGGSAGLQQLQADARRTGYVLSEEAARDAETFKDRLLDAQLGLQGMKNTIGAALMPAVSNMMRDLSRWMGENRAQVQAFATEFGQRFRAAVPIIVSLAQGVAAGAAAFGSVTKALANVVGGFDNLGIILAGLFALKPVLAILGLGQALFTAGAAVIGLAGGLPAIAAGIKAVSLAMMTNPIVLAITAIVGAIALLIRYWDRVKAIFDKLPDWLTGGGGEYQTAGARRQAARNVATSASEASAVRLDTGAPVRTTSHTRVEQNNRIEINAQPGQSPEDIGREVERALARYEQRAQSRQRSALRDID